MRSRAQTGIAFRGRARWGLRVSSPSSYEPSFESVEQRVSYGIALNMGANLTRQGVEIDVGAFMAGLIDGLAQRKPRVSEAALQEAFAAAQKKADEHTAAQAAHQSGAAQAFLNLVNRDVLSVQKALPTIVGASKSTVRALSP